MRERPSERGLARAIERVMADARQCLRSGDPSVMVAGAFDGVSGMYRVARTATWSGGIPSAAVDTCVRAVSERAHVRAFRVPSAAYAFTVVNGDASGATAGMSSSSSGSTGAAGSTGSSGSSSVGSNPGGGFHGTPSVVPSPASLVRAHGESYQRCYEQALDRDHTVAGTVRVRMLLDGAGVITRLACDSESDHPDPTLMQIVSRCVEQHVRTIHFGPQVDPGSEIVVPLTFHPGGR